MPDQHGTYGYHDDLNETHPLLTPDEIKDLRHQLAELYDITLRYVEIVAKADQRNWEADRPKFRRRKGNSLDEALALYQDALDEFEAERKAAYDTLYKLVKADSFDRVAQVERYIDKFLAAHTVEIK